jgi:hypothetical protein
MDDAWFAERALAREKRAQERERRRTEDAKFLAEFEKRSSVRQDKREAREELLSQVESDARLKATSRASLAGASSSSIGATLLGDVGNATAVAAAERRRQAQEEEIARQLKREEEKKRRDAQRESARIAADEAAVAEEAKRKQRDEERRLAREAADRELEQERLKVEAEREAARQARLQAQADASAAEAKRVEDERIRKLEELKAAEEREREAEKLKIAEREKKAADEARIKAENDARVAVEEAQRETELQKKKEDARKAKEDAEKTKLAAAELKATEDAKRQAEIDAENAKAAAAAEAIRQEAELKAKEEKMKREQDDARLTAQAQADADAQAAASKKRQEEEDAERVKEAEARKTEFDAKQVAQAAAQAEMNRQIELDQMAEKKQNQQLDDETEAELKRLAEEEEILKEDEARLAAEEAAEKAAAAAKTEDNGDELDDEEAALLAEEEALRLEEEVLKKAEEDQRAEDARLLAEEEAELAREEAAFESMKIKQQQEEDERNAAAAKAEADENSRIEAELLREDAERVKLAAAAAAEEEANKKKAQEEEEDARLKKDAEDKAKAEEEAKKEVPEPSPAPTAAASKKNAFLAALNNKIGLGGPPPKVKPEPQQEDTPANVKISVEETQPQQDGAETTSTGPKLTHLTQKRAKGPQRNHRATMAGIKSRMNADGTTSFFVGEVQATPHIDGQVVAASSSSGDSASPEEATERAPTSEPIQKKLPPGAKGMPGMSMGGLMAAIKKSEERRASGGSSDLSTSPASSTGTQPSGSDSKLPNVRLIQVRGKGKDLAVRLVEPTLSGLSHDCAYILEDVKAAVLYVWSGYSANKMQTTKCLDLVTRINRIEHAGRATNKSFRAGEETAEFWTLLGCSQAQITPTLAKSLAQTNNLPIVNDTLYRLDPTETSFALIEMASEMKNLERGLLWSDACYILDSCYELRVWIGKTSPKEMREAVLAQANELLGKPTKNGEVRPAWSQHIYKEADRGETALFTDKFATWPAEYKPKVAAAPPSRARAISAAPSAGSPSSSSSSSTSSTPTSVAASPKTASPAKPSNSRMAPWDGSSMAAIERPASADKILPDDGVSGSLKTWIQDGFEKKALPASRIGIYDDVHCYLELYTWGMPGSERFMVYFWQGQATSPNDQGSVAGLAREVNERICKGSGQLVRVPQFQEAEHFLLSHAMQQQPYVSLGASLNGSLTDGSSTLTVRFIHVRGKSGNSTKAHQVAVDASLLNTNDVFILLTDSGKVSPLENVEAPYLAEVKQVQIWEGKSSDKLVREYAKSLAKRLAGEATTAQVIEEGNESLQFWKTLGQKSGFEDYTKVGQLDTALKIYMSTANSQEGFKIGRIWDYSNADVCSDRVLIVEDSTHRVFLWMGARTAEPERKLSLESAISYAQTIGSPNAPVYMYEGHETLQFRSLFHGWTAKPKFDTKTVPGAGDIASLLPLYDATFPLTQLKDRASLPPTVDQAHLEYHLNRDDFPEALKMTQDAFFALPEWKRLEAKKSSPIY